MDQTLLQRSHRVLRREPIVMPHMPDELLGSKLAFRGNEVLGYKVLEKEVTTFRNLTQILQALKSLNIEPFTNESVEVYKQQEIRRASNFWQLCHLSPGWSWYWDSIDEISLEIPPAVIETAILIKERCPEVFGKNKQNFITVHRLQREQSVGDPFLAVTLSTRSGYKHIYVACWDEPRFSAHVVH